LVFKAGFSKADEVWQPPQEELPSNNASLYSKYRFKDAKTVLSNMERNKGLLFAEGENRAKEAIVLL
jgi:hypothetical protein